MNLVIDALYFKLPDDFKGGLSDALRAAADYHDEVKHTRQRRTDVSREIPWPEMRKALWKEFLEAVADGDRLCGCACLSEEDGTNMDLNA